MGTMMGIHQIMNYIEIPSFVIVSSKMHCPYANHGAGIYINIYPQNPCSFVGVHIPAPWFACGICFETYKMQEKSATWTTCNGDSNTGLLPFHPKYVWELSWPNNEARKPISPPNVAQVYHRVLITRWRNPATPALFLTFWWPQMHLVPS